AFTENQAVKRGVDDIAHCPGENKGDIEDETPVVFFLHHVMQAIGNAHHRSDAEERKCQFAGFAAELQAKRHTIVFGKMDDEPVAKNLIFLPGWHIQFYPKLGKLVYQEYRSNQYEGFGITFHVT